MNFDKYDSGVFFDELFDAQSEPRITAKLLIDAIRRLPDQSQPLFLRVIFLFF